MRVYSQEPYPNPLPKSHLWDPRTRKLSVTTLSACVHAEKVAPYRPFSHLPSAVLSLPPPPYSSLSSEVFISARAPKLLPVFWCLLFIQPGTRQIGEPTVQKVASALKADNPHFPRDSTETPSQSPALQEHTDLLPLVSNYQFSREPESILNPAPALSSCRPHPTPPPHALPLAARVTSCRQDPKRVEPAPGKGPTLLWCEVVPDQNPRI